MKKYTPYIENLPQKRSIDSNDDIELDTSKRRKIPLASYQNIFHENLENLAPNNSSVETVFLVEEFYNSSFQEVTSVISELPKEPIVFINHNRLFFSKYFIKITII